MKTSGPTYLVKSRSGQVLVSGSAQQVSDWIREKRIGASDFIQREGLALFECDEAWARLECFPELFGPSGWIALDKKMKRAKIAITASLFILLVGVVLIAASHLLPAYDASLKIRRSKEAEESAFRQADAAKAGQAAAEGKERAAVEAARLEKLRAEDARRLMEGQVKATELAEAKAAKLANDIDLIKKTMPIIVRWRKSLLDSDYMVMVVTNTSTTPLKLLVSVYDGKGVQTKKQFSMNLAPAGLVGSQAESGIGETVAHYFKKGEAAEFTDVDASKDYRYTPISNKCP